MNIKIATVKRLLALTLALVMVFTSIGLEQMLTYGFEGGGVYQEQPTESANQASEPEENQASEPEDDPPEDSNEPQESYNQAEENDYGSQYEGSLPDETDYRPEDELVSEDGQIEDDEVSNGDESDGDYLDVDDDYGYGENQTGGAEYGEGEYGYGSECAYDCDCGYNYSNYGDRCDYYGTEDCGCDYGSDADYGDAYDCEYGCDCEYCEEEYEEECEYGCECEVCVALRNAATPMIGILPASTYTVYFNPMGGNMLLGQEWLMVPMNTAIGAAMPTEPLLVDHIFRHWEDSQGNIFDGDTIVTETQTVYAQWGHMVTFVPLRENARGWLVGTDQNNPAHFLPRIVTPGMNMADMPGVVFPNNLQNSPGVIFLGWFDNSVSGQGNPVDENTPITHNMNVYAQWGTYNLRVDFSPNGGSIGSGHTPFRYVEPGRSILESGNFPHLLNAGVTWRGSAPQATRSGLTLEGWWIDIGYWYSDNANDRRDNRFAPPGMAGSSSGGNLFDSGSQLVPNTAGLSRTRVFDNKTVYANWVARVRFLHNSGNDNAASSANRVRDIPLSVITEYGSGTVGDHGRWLNTSEDAATRGDLTGEVRTGMPSNPSRAGFRFLGWYDARITDENSFAWYGAGLTDAEIYAQHGIRRVGGATEITGNTNFFARWGPIVDGEPGEMWVIFNPNGGTFPSTPSGVPNEDGIRGPIPMGASLQTVYGIGTHASLGGRFGMPRFPTRSGFVFAGWFTPNVPTHGNPITGTANAVPFNPNNNRFGLSTNLTVAGLPAGEDWPPYTHIHTVYARWLPTHRITFDSNGGSPTTPRTRDIAQGFSFNQMRIIWGNGFERHGISGGGNSQWHLGDNSPSASGINVNTTRTGYRFVGWNTRRDGTGTNWTNSRANNQPRTLYAQWETIIRFNNNHTSIGGAANNTFDQWMTVGRTIANHNQTTHVSPRPAGQQQLGFPPVQFVMNNVNTELFSFIGWNTRADGTGEWWTENTVLERRNTVLYAIFNQTSIMFMPGLAPYYVIAEEDRYRRFDRFPNYLNNHLDGMPDDPIWPGHNFEGWVTAEGFNADGDSVFQTPTIIYARWSGTVRFFPNGAGGVVTHGLSAYTNYRGQGIAIGNPLTTWMDPISVQRTGSNDVPWRFTGWNTQPDGSSTGFTRNTVVMQSTNVYAQWGGRLIFDLNGGNIDFNSIDNNGIENDNPYFVVPEDDTLVITDQAMINPTRQNYEFLGWIRADNPSMAPISTADARQISMDDSEITLIAVWNVDLPLITKVASPSHVNVDGTVTYTLTVTNPNAIVHIADVEVVDVIDSRLTFVADSIVAPEHVVAVYNSGRLTATIASLPPGHTVITFRVTADISGAGQDVPNRAYLYVDGEHVDDGSALISVNQSNRPTIIKTAEPAYPAEVAIGGTVEYTLEIGNPNDFALVNVVVTDTIPQHLTFVEGSAEVAAPAVGEVNFDSATRTLTVTFASLPADGATITFEVTAEATGAGSTIRNTAMLTWPSGSASDTADVAIEAGDIPTIVKSVAPELVLAGQAITYTIAVTNPNEQLELRNLVVVDELDSRFTLTRGSVQVNGSPASYTLSAGNELRVTLAQLAPGATSTVTFIVTAGSEAEGQTITNAAFLEVPGLEEGDQPRSEEVEVEIWILPTIEKRAQPVRVEIGWTVTYTIAVTNPNEELELQDVVVVDAIDDRLRFVAGSVRMNGEPVEYEFEGRVLRVILATLSPGGEYDVTFDVVVNPEAYGQTIENIAFLEVPGNEGEPPSAEVEIQVRNPGGQQLPPYRPYTPQPPRTPDDGPSTWYPGRPPITPPYTVTHTPTYQMPQTWASEAYAPATAIEGYIPSVVEDYIADDIYDVLPPAIYGAENIEARGNPQTGDGMNVLGLMASLLGLFFSAAAIILARRRLTQNCTETEITDTK